MLFMIRKQPFLHSKWLLAVRPVKSALCVSCSNPVVQVKAVEGGALQTLLTLLATTQPLGVRKKVLAHTTLLCGEGVFISDALCV